MGAVASSAMANMAPGREYDKTTQQPTATRWSTIGLPASARCALVMSQYDVLAPCHLHGHRRCRAQHLWSSGYDVSLTR